MPLVESALRACEYLVGLFLRRLERPGPPPPDSKDLVPFPACGGGAPLKPPH